MLPKLTFTLLVVIVAQKSWATLTLSRLKNCLRLPGTSNICNIFESRVLVLVAQLKMTAQEVLTALAILAFKTCFKYVSECWSNKNTKLKRYYQFLKHFIG